MSNGHDMKTGEFRGTVLTELEHIKRTTVEIRSLVEDNTGRIGSLENKWAWATGVASTVGAISAFLMNKLFK